MDTSTNTSKNARQRWSSKAGPAAESVYKQVECEARPTLRSERGPAPTSKRAAFRAQTPTEGLSAAEHHPRKTNNEEVHKRTVLLVEDNADMLFYLETELLSIYRVICENNGADGLETAVREVPDVIVSDVMMPKMDGREMCRQLKSDERTKHIPVILLTAKSQDQDRVAGLSSGADVYFSKPFSTKVLRAQIASIIANRIASTTTPTREEKSQESGQSELDRRFMESAERIIRQHLADTSFNPEVLADRLGISARQLYRKLNAISGDTVSELILRIRMDKAAELLQDWRQNISEVATNVGFTEASNFSRAFRKHFGSSPTEYRAKF